MSKSKRYSHVMHLERAYDGPTLRKFVLHQVKGRLDEYTRALAGWVASGETYPITDEDRRQMGFFTAEEVKSLYGVDVGEEHLAKGNAWAYDVFCAVRHVGRHLGIAMKLMPFVEYRQMVLKCMLIEQGFFRHGGNDGPLGTGKIARSKMFKTPVVPRPIDRVAMNVAHLSKPKRTLSLGGTNPSKQSRSFFTFSLPLTKIRLDTSAK